VALLGVVVAGEVVYAALALLEWGSMEFGSPEAALAYHFGTEAMIGEGGFLYRSRLTYESYALVAGCVGAAVAVLAGYATLKRRSSSYAVVAILIGLQLAAEWLVRR
jgi:hypothetical protein